MERVDIRAVLKRHALQERRVRQESRDNRPEESVQADQGLLAGRLPKPIGREEGHRWLSHEEEPRAQSVKVRADRCDFHERSLPISFEQVMHVYVRETR